VSDLSPIDGDQEPQKVFFVSLGCPKNQVDSELMLGELTARHMVIVEDAEEADVLVVNTCSFVEEAREESVETILDLAHIKANASKAQKLQRLTSSLAPGTSARSATCSPPVSAAACRWRPALWSVDPATIMTPTALAYRRPRCGRRT
jgi:hypothetical protein